MNQHYPPIHKTITINASAAKVWKALTDPDLMNVWMLDTEITISTDWKVGNPFIVSGNLHWTDFENKGRVLKFDPEKTMSYNFLSSLSKLPDAIENYTLIEFGLLSSTEEETIVTLMLDNFPTEEIYRHLVFYWGATLVELKKFVEQ